MKNQSNIPNSIGLQILSIFLDNCCVKNFRYRSIAHIWNCWADYDKRALFYWAKIYIEQLKAAEDYSKLTKAIGINILNFTSIPEAKKYHNVFHITEKETGLLYFQDLELHTIELTKFSSDSNEELADIVLKVKNALDMWSAFLTRNDLLILDNLPKELNDQNLKKAINVLNVMNFSAEEREAYEDRLKWLRIEANTIKNYEQRGEIRGREAGREVGILIGEDRGKAKEKIEIAKKLLAQNCDINIISVVTGLSHEQIKKLKM